MTAFDSDDVDRVTTVDVSIEVLRNEHAPQFDRDNIQLQLNETARIGEPVLTLTASDEDPADVIRYSIVGDVTARQFFFVDSATGNVSLKRPLSESDASVFTVNIRDISY